MVVVAVAVVVVFCYVAVCCVFVFILRNNQLVRLLRFCNAPSLCEAVGFAPGSKEPSVPDHSVRVRSDRFQIPVSGFVHPRCAQVRGTVFQQFRSVFHQLVVLGLEADAHAFQVRDVDLDGIHVGLMCWCYS